MLNMSRLTNIKEKQPILYSFIREMAIKEYEWLIHSGNTTNYTRKEQEKLHKILLEKGLILLNTRAEYLMDLKKIAV